MAGSILKRHKRIVGKILETENISSEISILKKQNKNIVLVGGCFDILHLGHLLFLEAAKKEGNILIVLLESDENIKKRKGNNRPINNAHSRQIIVSSIKSVDYVIPLKGVTSDLEYDRLMSQIKPDVVAITEGDSQTEKRKIQCEETGTKLKTVIKLIDNNSTTALINKIK
jgi:rfaE bifunctional protein nucleotidyltransferase chain/domain